jgi:hypothetical protein
MKLGINHHQQKNQILSLYNSFDWGSDTEARIKINGKKQTADSKVRQGIIRDTDGTRTLVIWIEQKSDEKVSYNLY